MNDNNLKCPNCGKANSIASKFCIGCGTNLQTQNTNNEQIKNDNVQSLIQQFDINNTTNTTNTVNINTNTQNININNQESIQTSENLNYIQYIIGVILNPYKKYKNSESSLNNIKNISILSLIIIGIMTISGLIQTMINSVRVTSYWTSEVKWVWENLKEINYFKLIGQSLLIYAGILLAVAGIYFVANIIMKKDAKFIKILSAVVTSFIPYAICSSIISPVLSMIYSILGICITIIGFIYTLLILIELINELIVIEDRNTRIYFHSICMSIISISGIIIAYRILSVTIGNLLS